MSIATAAAGILAVAMTSPAQAVNGGNYTFGTIGASATLSQKDFWNGTYTIKDTAADGLSAVIQHRQKYAGGTYTTWIAGKASGNGKSVKADYYQRGEGTVHAWDRVCTFNTAKGVVVNCSSWQTTARG